jgi:glycosyltransferase involved in cell wall biosynthesis
MRVLMLSKACIVGIYQRKLELIAATPNLELLVLVPPYWRDERGVTRLERLYTDGYTLQVTPLRFNGNYHLHYYPQFGRYLRQFQPDIVHIDEEPYNLATWLALRAAQRAGSKTLFFSWQNINRRYPFPFNRLERQVLHQVDYALVGTESAAAVWRDKGYRGALEVVPQFGVDTELFHPRQTSPDATTTPTIGYVGRLWHGKGIDTLIIALAKLKDLNWHLHLIGSGPEEATIQAQLRQQQLQDRTTLTNWVPSVEMPAKMRALDMLVLPSRTLPSWKEQYGRVLLEAMASGVVVVGSDSGAIPNVIADAGLVFREDDAQHLAAQLRRVLTNPEERRALAAAGPPRVATHFTQPQIAQKTVQVYQKIYQT